jgi:hypothetical protein
MQTPIRYGVAVKGLSGSTFYESIIQDTNFTLYPEEIRKRRLGLIQLE